MHRVLLIDDSAIFRRSVRSLLGEPSQWEVCGEAENGDDGVRLCDELRPDAIVLDISMPGSDGLSVAKIIRGKHADIKLVLLSFHSSQELAKTVLGAGGNAFVVKSAAHTDLVAALNAVVNNQTYISPTLETPKIAMTA